MILRLNVPQAFQHLPKWKDIKKATKLVQYIFYSGLTEFGDFFAFSVTTIYIGTRNNYIDTGAWVLFINIYVYIIFFDVAQSSIVKSDLNKAMAMKDEVEPRSLIMRYFFYSVGWNAIVLFFLLLFRK